MGAGRFHAANVLSALIWTPAMLAPGYIVAGGLGALPAGILGEGSALASWIAAVVAMTLGCLLILQSLRNNRSAGILRPA